MRLHPPTRMFPSTAAPAPISTPSPIFGMPVAVLLAGAAERHRVQHRDVVADHRRLADDDGMGVVDHDPVAHPGAGMDVDPEHLRGPHLDEIGHVLAPPRPEPVADAVALQRLEPLEEQQRLQIAVAGRVALEDRQDVGPRRDAELRVVLHRPRRRSPAGSARSSPARPASARCDSSAPARGCCGAGSPHARGSPSAARPGRPAPPRSGSSSRPGRRLAMLACVRAMPLPSAIRSPRRKLVRSPAKNQERTARSRPQTARGGSS